MTKTLISNVRGPQGERGPAGPTGVAGPAGPNTVPTNQAVADAVGVDGPARQALLGTFVAVRTSDGKALPAGTIVVITLDKTLAQITASPVADIADITFQTGA